ncbi:hypothetical protein TcYC6_0026040 [Trypanosoma cruzi]|nr:hypothetical protein TcYC6_0026040 [Trypanosoma cruzi]
MVKIMEKLLCSQPGLLSFRIFSLHINTTSDDTWVSTVVYFHKYRTVFWGSSNGSPCLANCKITVWIQIVRLHNWSSVPQQTLFYGMRRGIPRSQSSFHLGSRQVREPSVVSKCHTELYSV